MIMYYIIRGSAPNPAKGYIPFRIPIINNLALYRLELVRKPLINGLSIVKTGGKTWQK